MSTSSLEWRHLPSGQAQRWNEILLRHADAHLFQYPYYNERFRCSYISANYFVCGDDNNPAFFAALLSLGPPGFRIGLLANGPVSLRAGSAPTIDTMRGFHQFAARSGYLFIRVTNTDREFMTSLSALSCVDSFDAFPYYPAYNSELIVPLTTDSDRLLRGFQEIARRNIRKAERVPYDIYSSSSADAFATVWPLFQRQADRKGITHGPLKRYQRLLRLAEPSGSARFYVASLAGVPVYAILMLRSSDTVHYQIGALDLGALGDRPSPSCLLHWRAMQDYAQEGIRTYNLGTRSGPVYVFKQKFRPTEVFNPKPQTIVVQPRSYRLWKASFSAVHSYLDPSTKALLRWWNNRASVGRITS